MTRILGIVNATADSFSDGGLWLRPEAAIAHARSLVAAGAQAIDVGAESTHPDSADVPAALEIERLSPVVDALLRDGIAVSVDTRKPEVMRAMAARGVHWINDVRGFRSEEAVAAAASCRCTLVVMYARQEDGRARREAAGGDAVADANAFFADRISALARAGVARERLVLDPGMGFFLGPDPETSYSMLRRLAELRVHGLPLLVSVSRKSFLAGSPPKPPQQRGAATLVAELFAARTGVDWIRTHDVQALADGLRVQRALQGPTA